ncbi:TPA: hypothetical protein ACFCAJ_001181 [Neisseria gonorrhoeae]
MPEIRNTLNIKAASFAKALRPRVSKPSKYWPAGSGETRAIPPEAAAAEPPGATEAAPRGAPPGRTLP